MIKFILFYFSVRRQSCRVSIRRNFMEYEVEVIETLKRQKVIEADSLNQALEKLQEEYKTVILFLMKMILLGLNLENQRMK